MIEMEGCYARDASCLGLRKSRVTEEVSLRPAFCPKSEGPVEGYDRLWTWGTGHVLGAASCGGNEYGCVLGNTACEKEEGREEGYEEKKRPQAYSDNELDLCILSSLFGYADGYFGIGQHASHLEPGL